MNIEFKIKGVTLDASDLCVINQYYEAACTAEYLLDNYEPLLSDEDALDLGYQVRHEMNKYGYVEEDAIALVMRRNFNV